MANDDKSESLNRRQFLTSASAVGIAAATLPGSDPAQADDTTPARPLPPGETELAAEFDELDIYSSSEVDNYFVDNPGSDFMVDVLKRLGFDYVTTNPGSSFRGIHESIVNYGGNTKPELMTCPHEEQAVAMGHGYYKVAGRPLAVACHGTVGIQHAAMAVYNAWCDRAPVILIAGNHLDATDRRVAHPPRARRAP